MIKMDNIVLYFKVAVSLVISGISVIIGGFDLLASCLLTFVVIDYITGILAALCTKTLSSRTGFNGIIKKICIFIVVAVAHCAGDISGINELRDIAVSFYIANEGISVLENLGRIGVPFPNKLKAVLAQLKKEAD